MWKLRELYPVKKAPRKRCGVRELKSGLSTSDLVEQMLSGDRRALSRLFTLLERDKQSREKVMRYVFPYYKGAYVIGITGPPGAGKSTLVNELLSMIRRGDETVGMLAFDPSSPFNMGGVLGDRIRLQNHFLDKEVYIRSFGARGSQGGLSGVASAAVRLLDAFGKRFILVETVGVGQTELDILGVADSIIVVLVPEAGDEVQMMKAGLMEIADIFVVNKSDRPGASRLANSIRNEVNPHEGSRQVERSVFLTQANIGEGVSDLYTAVLEHQTEMQESSLLEARRKRRLAGEFERTIRDSMSSLISEILDNGIMRSMSQRVEVGEMDPYSGAVMAFNQLHDSGERFLPAR